MLAHTCGLLGLPGTGKSTLLRAYLAATAPPAGWTPFADGLVRGLAAPGVRVLGVYDDAPFPGTDRLSFAVLPALLRWLDTVVVPDPAPVAVLWEGDRLSVAPWLAACEARGPVTWLLLTTPPAALSARWAARPAAPSPAWLKGRASKLSRLVRRFPTTASAHASPADTARLVAWLRQVVPCPILPAAR